MALTNYVKEFEKIYFLNQKNPIAAWEKRLAEIIELREKLNRLEIERVEVVAPSIHLKMEFGPNKKWLGASGRNLPSSEVFTSPDWRTVEGEIKFNVPMNKYGYSIKNIHCIFENGIVTKYTCDNDKDQLDKILGQSNMLKVGEFSLTDKKLSEITKYMATSILDENLGGEHGNMHLALGTSYKNAYPNFDTKLSAVELEKIGFNQAGDHIDFMNTENKEVTAWSKKKGKLLLYKHGEFQI